MKDTQPKETKKAYKTPVLKVYGDVRVFTQGKATGGHNDGRRNRFT